ncbi:MAG: tetratricopeptide (TPR) repeat protein [Planctomycetota bacterium]|jgi:tetratricopeptide (TPR) repeat protein
MTQISLCLVARDCEESLERCLTAAAPAVDEICVVDLGSTDRTREVAEAHGALVISHRWNGDAAAAFETALAMCVGDWILLLDPEEELCGEDPKAELGSFLQLHGRTVGSFPCGERRSTAADFMLPSTRFLPTSAGLQFEGRERPQLTGEPIQQVEFALDLIIPAKTASATPVECLIKSGPDPNDDAISSCESWYGLGMSLRLQGRNEEALEAFTEALERATSDTEFVPHLFECTSYCMRSLGRPGEALNLMDQIEGAFLDRPDTRFAVALLCMDTHEFERAEIGFQRCLQLDGEHFGGGPTEPGRTSYAAYHNLGVLREMLDMFDEALECYEKALTCNAEYQPSVESADRLRAKLALTNEQS